MRPLIFSVLLIAFAACDGKTAPIFPGSAADSGSAPAEPWSDSGAIVVPADAQPDMPPTSDSTPASDVVLAECVTGERAACEPSPDSKGFRLCCKLQWGPCVCRPKPETCNQLDDDCDGEVDEGPLDGTSACDAQDASCEPGAEELATPANTWSAAITLDPRTFDLPGVLVEAGGKIHARGDVDWYRVPAGMIVDESELVLEGAQGVAYALSYHLRCPGGSSPGPAHQLLSNTHRSRSTLVVGACPTQLPCANGEPDVYVQVSAAGPILGCNDYRLRVLPPGPRVSPWFPAPVCDDPCRP